MLVHAFAKMIMLLIDIVEANILFQTVKGAKSVRNIFIDFPFY